MRWFTVAPAALVLASAAHSQSSQVTLFGVLDASVSSYRNRADLPFGGSTTTSQTVLTNSGLSASRLGFRGTEDLGGGLFANFWLEAGLDNDDGTGTGSSGTLQFNRRSTVSVGGSFGEIRLGRDYTPTYWNDNLFDPFGVNGVGTSAISTAMGQAPPGSVKSGFTQNTTYQRASNSIGYFLPPDLGGAYGQVIYAFNESTRYSPGGLTPPGAAAVLADPMLAADDNARAGRYIGGRLGYAKGPVDVAIAYGESTVASNFFGGSTTTLQIWSIGGTYDFGMVKLFGEYSNNKQKIDLSNHVFNPSGTTAPGFNGALIGLIIPVAGFDQIRMSYSEVRYNNVNNLSFANPNPDPKADKFALGYVYNFSKRTALYATVAYLRNKDGAGLTVGGPDYFTAAINGLVPVPNKSVGYDLGMRYSF